ncbi:MAG: NAD(P)/FAD-dependent oxidoreductase [Planctomycetes bacterium]|nr:NAD(P)/FAD-dependent oxidoreductase [Planctomycetota bacterium]
MTADSNNKKVVIIGAGPAGLTAAVELCRRSVPTLVAEKDKLVGGIARTEQYKGYYFDIGGHRFFTKIGEVEVFWREMLGTEFITRPRISRIYYKGRFFDYPLKAMNALRNLGVFTSSAVVMSYIYSTMFPHKKEDTFEEWVTNRFGNKLYLIFFKTYTEKVWGIPCSEIRAEWAAQRIKGLSLPIAVRNAIFGKFRFGGGGGVVKTLIEEFQYPRLGPGMMWNACRDYVNKGGGSVELETDVVEIRHDGRRVRSAVFENLQNHARTEQTGTDFISSMPVAELIHKLRPAPPAEVLRAASGLAYRDFITVVLIIRKENLFHDNWIYIHSPGVKVGRVQNFKNWSIEMVADPKTTSLGLEYFCNEGDGVWGMPDADLIELGKREMEQIGLLRAADVFDGTVVRQKKAYPIYNSTYGGYLNTLQSYLLQFENLQTIGRNGLHKYNNQDHSMLTAMLAVRNVLGEKHDVWNVNTERSYHEEIRVSKGGAEKA